MDEFQQYIDCTVSGKYPGGYLSLIGTGASWEVDEEGKEEFFVKIIH